jgi:hypothetical protein
MREQRKTVVLTREPAAGQDLGAASPALRADLPAACPVAWAQPAVHGPAAERVDAGLGATVALRRSFQPLAVNPRPLGCEYRCGMAL